MDIRMRTDKGPRDWSPAAPTPAEEYVPFAQEPLATLRSAPNPFRSVGLLTLLTGATALFAQVALILRPDVEFLLHFAFPPLAIIVGFVAMAVLRSLGVINRIAAVVGLALGVVASLLLVASLTGFLDGVHTLDAPWPPTPAQVAEQEAALAAESLALSTAVTTAQMQLAGTLATTGTYPLTLDVDSDVLTTPAGVIELPTGASVAYSSDGTSYLLILTGELGAVAQLDSVRGAVLTTTLVS